MPRETELVRLPPFRVEAAMATLSETVDWGLASYGIPEQWSSTRGAGVRVAVLDTGIESRHDDLREGIAAARDFTRSRSGVEDRNGHGTHVAGTIGARKNSRGVVGVAPECRLLVGKVLDDGGSGSGRSVAAGIDWACAEGAEIISMSLGSASADGAIRSAIERATRDGRLVICAAGNDGRSNSVNYPARWPETTAVAAVDRNGRVARFSSRGPEVDVAAPGQDVLSTYLRGGYAKLSGTSMATPFVTGVVALLIARRRKRGEEPLRLTAVELREELRRTSRDAGPVGHDPNYGWGMINPAGMLSAVEDGDGDGAAEYRIGPVTINGVRGSLVFEAETGR